MKFLTARHQKGKAFIEQWVIEHHNYIHFPPGKFLDLHAWILQHRRERDLKDQCLAPFHMTAQKCVVWDVCVVSVCAAWSRCPITLMVMDASVWPSRN